MRRVTRGLLLAGLMALAAPVAAQEMAPVRMNQLGFVPDGRKLAVLSLDAGAPVAWRVVDASGKTVAEGMTRVFGADAASGEHVHQVDLSAVRKTGQSYRLIVGTAESRPFAIAADLYEPLASGALAFFYHQRAGTPIEARFVGQEWARPAGHAKETAPCFKGADERSNQWPGCGYALDVTGGWYDAGDHGKYLVNGGITLWTLQNLAEYRARAFPDGSARIPEAGNGIRDLLDEARWEMEFFLKMQVPEGTKMQLPVGAQGRGPYIFSAIDAGGMAHQKVADDQWTGLPMPPQDDPRPRLLHAPTTGATLNLAATAAQCARLWRTIDPAFSARCLKAAERAWAAALRNPEIYATSSFAGSGGYGDRDVSDEFFWAASELYVTTAKAAYGDAIRRSPHFTSEVAEAGWPNTGTLGTITLAAVQTGLSEGEKAAQRTRLVAAADRILADGAKQGYALPYAPPGYPWGSNSNLLNRAMLLALAADFTREAKYRDGVIDALDYVLGRNPLDRSYVSGFGARPMLNPHHRFWAHSLDPKLPGPPPGVLSGGPNSTSMADEVAAKMKGKCAPLKCWVDDIHAFSMNEVAINWNAPLLWVASWASEP